MHIIWGASMRYPETGYKKYMTDDEVKLFLNFVKSKFHPSFYIGAIFMAKYGLRVSDACKIRLQDIDFINQTITIDQMKTGKVYDLPLTEDILQHVRAFITIFELQIQDHNGYLLWSPASDIHILESSYRAIWKSFRDQYGFNNAYHYREYSDGRVIKLTRLTNHALRHYVANKIMDKADVRYACAVLGHSNPSVTLKHYSHIISDMNIIRNVLNQK
jgi:integrase